MNKYFLSLISILILFQTFHVIDEMFFKEKNQKDKGYIIIKSTEPKKKFEKEEIKEKVNLDLLFQTTNIKKGIKISKQCSACHDISKKLKLKTGPSLWGIVDRKAAVISDFSYSEALTNFKKIWTIEELFDFLEEPKKYIEGTKMIYSGLKKIEDRINLISYLRSLN